MIRFNWRIKICFANTNEIIYTYSIICLKQGYLQNVVDNQTVYILMAAREIRMKFLGPGLVSTSPWVSSNREQKNQKKQIPNKTSYFGKAIWVTKLIHNNWMRAIVEDSNTSTPLKYINRHQVNLKPSSIPKTIILWKIHSCNKLKLEHRFLILLTQI